MSGASTSFTTAELAERVGGDLRGRPDLAITGVEALDEATAHDVTFVADKAHAARWPRSAAGAALVTEGLDPEGHDPDVRAIIVVPDAALAMIEVLGLFAPPAPDVPAGLDATASVHAGARLGRDVCIGPHVSIGAGATVGDRVVLHPGVRLYADTSVGEDSVLHANSVVRERCRLGRRVILHPNATIGADGFGYEPAPDGSGVLKVPQIGIVVIEDDVEIGAGSCVDRAKFGRTVVGAGSKIDNLVQIGHNCRIGRGCVIAALSGLGGSVTLGDGVRVGGAVGIADHIHVGRGAALGAHSGVMRDVPEGKTMLGSPAYELREHFRQLAAIRRLPEWMRQASHLFKADLR